MCVVATDGPRRTFEITNLDQVLTVVGTVDDHPSGYRRDELETVEGPVSARRERVFAIS